MEQRAYQKWTRGLLLGLVLVLMACAAVVYRVDPCFYYRMPTDREPEMPDLWLRATCFTGFLRGLWSLL